MVKLNIDRHACSDGRMQENVKKKGRRGRGEFRSRGVEQILDGSLDAAAGPSQGLDVPVKLEEAHVVELPKLLGVPLLWGTVVRRLRRLPAEEGM